MSLIFKEVGNTLQLLLIPLLTHLSEIMLLILCDQKTHDSFYLQVFMRTILVHPSTRSAICQTWAYDVKEQSRELQGCLEHVPRRPCPISFPSFTVGYGEASGLFFGALPLCLTFCLQLSSGFWQPHFYLSASVLHPGHSGSLVLQLPSLTYGEFTLASD